MAWRKGPDHAMVWPGPDHVMQGSAVGTLEGRAGPDRSASEDREVCAAISHVPWMHTSQTAPAHSCAECDGDASRLCLREEGCERKSIDQGQRQGVSSAMETSMETCDG
jgi:hypothetical protein